MQAELETNIRYTLHKWRSNFHLATLSGGFKSQNTSLVWSASSNLLGRIACPWKSIFWLNKLHFFRFKVTVAFCKSESTLRTCDICSSGLLENLIVSLRSTGENCHFIGDINTSAVR